MAFMLEALKLGFNQNCVCSSMTAFIVLACLLDVMRNILFAEMADQLHLFPCHAAFLLSLHNSACIAPPFGSRASLLGPCLRPEMCIGSSCGIRGEPI